MPRAVQDMCRAASLARHGRVTRIRQRSVLEGVMADRVTAAPASASLGSVACCRVGLPGRQALS